MRLGTMTKTYERPTLEAVFQAMAADGLYEAQLNLLSAGMETMPAAADDARIREIRLLAERCGISLCGLSGTFNMIDPDEDARAEGCRRFEVLCCIAARLNVPVVALCTGSKNPISKWEWHDDNDSEAAWADLMRTTETILNSAERHGVYLGVEIEASNIVNSSQRARRYLDAFYGSKLKILMDGANLFTPERVGHMRETLEEAFALIGGDIVLAHAKDLAATRALAFVAAGEGVLDFEWYIQLLRRCHYNGPLIMHGLSEKQVASSKRFLVDKLTAAAAH